MPSSSARHRGWRPGSTSASSPCDRLLGSRSSSIATRWGPGRVNRSGRRRSTPRVITTINPPTPAVLGYIAIPSVDVIIVADRKTPDAACDGLACTFLSLARQRAMAPAYDEILPHDHYARKNMGYLYAIRAGYSVIVESDDDNIPSENWPSPRGPGSIAPAHSSSKVISRAAHERGAFREMPVDPVASPYAVASNLR